MAVLKDLIVHGRSRFVNGAQFNNLQAQTIDATNGYFKYLKAIDGDIENLTVEELLAQNATVVGLLDVKGEMHTNSWTNANIANIGGSFYISPTLSSAASSVTISTYHDNGTNTDYYSIAVSGGSFATSSSGITWSTGSKVMVTGSVTKDNVTYPLGTCTGNLSAISSTSFTVNQIAQSGIDSAIPGDSTTNGSLAILINTFGSGTIFTSDEIKISMYEIGPSTAYKPVGILLTSYGINKETYIDIYGGVNVKNTDLTDNIPDGFTDPNVRIGYLGGIPAYQDSNGNSHKPVGWGIYTDNGYFKGVVVADSGLVGNFTISTDLHSGTTGIGLGTNVYVSPGTQAPAGISIANSPENLIWAFTAGSNFGVTTNGTLYANNAEIKGKIKADSGYIASGITIGSGGTTTIGDVNTTANNASYSVEIQVSDINYINNSATLVAKVYYKGELQNNPSVNYFWSKIGGTGAIPNTVVTNTATLQLPQNSDLAATYVCTIS